MSRTFSPWTVLAAAFVLLVPFAQASPSDAYMSDVRLSRTFVPPTAQAHAGIAEADFEVTRSDFVDLFAYGFEVHIGSSPEGKVYPYDVGFSDDANRQGWTVPDAELATVVWTIVDPATTPYATLYPGATHALVTTADPAFDGTRYQFYSVEEQRLVISGRLDVPRNDGEVIDETFGSTKTLFPLNEATGFFEPGFHYYAGEDAEEGIDPTFPYQVESILSPHGFGELLRPDGTAVEVGAFYNEWNVIDPDEPEVCCWEFEDNYSIFGVDGTWLTFRIAEQPGYEPGDWIAVQGDVYIDEVQYWRVVDPNATAAEAGPGEAPSWSLYPNPTADVVRFSEPLTATVYDVRGRAVHKVTLAREIDLRGLTSGTYVVRSEAGQSRTVTVRR